MTLTTALNCFYRRDLFRQARKAIANRSQKMRDNKAPKTADAVSTPKSATSTNQNSNTEEDNIDPWTLDISVDSGLVRVGKLGPWVMGPW
ncbi:expressed unknown protein [Seminavis robusta]|uniref:Uncharacterized protein n=1 Tax=Seminavis robusta TaxID=568900 RepID=A0A9N8HG56_9STRA|nr:expressed unknown protein [Seminavis robusta]|eukprot:Sro466_g148710.1 n/a (90) ;mRNA; f:3178-3538